MTTHQTHVRKKRPGIVFNYKILFLALTEQEKIIAELGKPKLGEKDAIRVRIRESKEFKVIFSFLP
jgi:hypothetical protein